MEVENGFDVETHRLQIKVLKEKVKNLVSDIDYFREVKQEEFRRISQQKDEEEAKTAEGTEEDDFLDISGYNFDDITCWLTGPDVTGPRLTRVEDILRHTYGDSEAAPPVDVSALIMDLKRWSLPSSQVSSPKLNLPDASVTLRKKAPIDSRTFTRPKKCTSRPSINSMMDLEESPRETSPRPKLQRKLTTTIVPSPNLITKLEALSRVNNRPVSGNWDEAAGVPPSQEGRASRGTIPASLVERLQELKKSNCAVRPTETNGNRASVVTAKDTDEHIQSVFIGDAKKLKILSEISSSESFTEHTSNRLVDAYFSDDNESFINLEDVSELCTRLARSTDQANYAALLLSETELFHTPEKLQSRMTLGGMEIPSKLILEDYAPEEEEEECLVDVNTTFTVQHNSTFEVEERTVTMVKDGDRTETYDTGKKLGLLEAIQQANLFPTNATNNNVVGAKNVLNETYEKNNGTSHQEGLYSSKLFDATYKKNKKGSPPETTKKRESAEHSEDDCMSTTSDTSYRSVESIPDGHIEGQPCNPTVPPRVKKLTHMQSSTPKQEPVLPCEVQRKARLSDGLYSPIRRETVEGEGSRDSSAASSRGASPGRVPQVLRHIRAPPRELKLKPALIQPTDNFRKPQSTVLGTKKTEVVPPRAVMTPPPCQAPPMRPPPSNTNAPVAVAPAAPRLSGIPRMPSRLKQPQIRTSTFSGRK